MKGWLFCAFPTWIISCLSAFKFHLQFYYQLTTNPFSAFQSVFIFANLNILESSANSSISLLSPTLLCCSWRNWRQQFPAQNPVELHWSSSAMAGTAALLYLPSFSHLCTLGHSPLHHDCLVSLGFWWVALSEVSWKAIWVRSNGSPLLMVVCPFKELRNWVRS